MINNISLHDVIFGFAFFYPLFMAWMWIAGGIWFFIKRELNQKALPEPKEAGCSILIPCFNEAEQVKQTIRYAMQSQYPKFEVIAINDGSSDNTGEVLDRLAEQHEKLRVVHLAQNQGKAGDFAQAYVIAHEVGHHVQNQLGISQKVDEASRRATEAQANNLSVRQELQADCFAGVWANRNQQRVQFLEQGDIEEAMNAAEQIGDDRLAQASGRAAVPDSFTHGTSQQRMTWFSRGLKSGDINQCDTFSGAI